MLKEVYNNTITDSLVEGFPELAWIYISGTSDLMIIHSIHCKIPDSIILHQILARVWKFALFGKLECELHSLVYFLWQKINDIRYIFHRTCLLIFGDSDNLSLQGEPWLFLTLLFKWKVSPTVPFGAFMQHFVHEWF